jgi:hypothetical protein
MVNFERMAKTVAQTLHTDTIAFYRPSSSVGKYGTPMDGEPEFLGEFKCSVQPFSMELAQKEYGLTVQAEKRVFTLLTPCAALGNLARIGDEWYRVEAVPDDRSMAVLLLARR